MQIRERENMLPKHVQSWVPALLRNEYTPEGGIQGIVLTGEEFGRFNRAVIDSGRVVEVHNQPIAVPDKPQYSRFVHPIKPFSTLHEVEVFARDLGLVQDSDFELNLR